MFLLCLPSETEKYLKLIVFPALFKAGKHLKVTAVSVLCCFSYLSPRALEQADRARAPERAAIDRKNKNNRNNYYF